MEQNWLNSVLSNLCAKCVDIVGDKATYLGFEPLELNSSVNGFNSNQICGNIIYKDEHGAIHKSKSIFIKRSVKLNMKLTISYSFINELNFYTKVIPVLSTLDSRFSSMFAKFHHGEMIFNLEGDQSIVILENLQARGYKMAEKKSFHDYPHLMLMMRKLGQFHAYSYKAKASKPDLFYPVANNFLETNVEANKESFNILGVLGKRGLEYLSQDPNYSTFVPKMYQMLENAQNIFIQILTGDRGNPSSVIAHGDYLSHNVMFRYENDIPNDLVIIDVATYRYGSPVLDLATVLYVNADQETRDKYWDCLIDEYYTALKETFPGNKIPSKREILLEFIDRSFFAYLIACLFLTLAITIDDNDVFIKDISDVHGKEDTRESTIEEGSKIGGKKGSQALSNILKDMIDRKFITK